MRLDRLLREEERLTDLAVDEALGNQLEDLDLARSRLLLQLAQWSRERDDLGVRATAASSRRVEPARMVDIPAQDLVALGSVHDVPIGLRNRLL